MKNIININLIEYIYFSSYINFIMFSFTEWLFRLFQYYGINFGYSYVFIDIKKGRVKFCKFAKIYVYLVNIIQFSVAAYGFANDLEFYDITCPMSSVKTMPNIFRMIAIINLVWLRIIEEKCYKKFCKTFRPLLKKYFDNPAHTRANDKTRDNYLSYQIFIIYLITLYHTKGIIGELLMCNWKSAGLLYIKCMFAGFSHYILWHHGVALGYVNYVFVNLNKMLENNQVQEPFSTVYIRMSLTLGRVNKLYSPIMSTTLFDILLRHSYQLYKIFKYFFNNQKVSNSLLCEIFVNLFEYISIVLYCLA